MEIAVAPIKIPFYRRSALRVPVAAAVLVILTASLTHLLDLRARTNRIMERLHPGPWGDLLEWNVRIPQPDVYLSFGKVVEDGPVWNFGVITTPALTEFLLSTGLTAEQASRIASMRRDDPAGNCLVHPDDELLLSLASEARSKLYRQLATIPSNRFQVNPFYISWDDVPTGYADPFSPEVRRLFAKLIYKRNGYTYFSDPEVILRHLYKPADRETFIKLLTSQSSVLLKVWITPLTDISKLIYYWSAPGNVHQKDLAPLLEAEQQNPNGNSVSILYLLPPLARENLYTTPVSSASNPAKLPDCHWTTLNFFTDKPDDRMRDESYASKYIADHYYPIGKPSVVGDIALFVNARNQIIHSAVYLADDIYFTKNGVNIAVPWVLMREKDLIGSYAALDPVTVLYYRWNAN
jgi:hypothetical protein